MKNLHKKKRMITCSVLLFSFLSISLFTDFLYENLFYKDDADKDDFTNFPKTSDSLPSFNGVGDKVNISLHQSYSNDSFNTALSPSDPNNNSFSLPCPKDLTFNSSLTNVTIKDIYAPNKTIIYEDDGIYPTLKVYSATYAASFKIEGTGYLNNVSVYLENGVDILNGSLTLQIYISKWDDSNSRSEPDVQYGGDLVSNIQIYNFTGWFNFTNLNKYLDVTSTQNNTFFLALREEGDDDVYWYFDYDHTAFPSQDFSDDLDCYEKTGATTWDYVTESWGASSYPIDFNLKCEFYPVNNTPKPTEIKLKINNDVVSDIDGDSGYWDSVLINSSASGELQYNVTADWWDVTCNISKVQINYTKTDLKADSSFEVLGNGQNVIWNVTRNGGLNYFGTDFNNYRINFTIPATWHDSSIKVFNGSDEWSINKRLLGNGYRDVEVPNAINGTFWFLNATSSNLLMDIKKYVGTMSVADTFNYTDFVHFNGTFSSYVSDGSINLSVYNPLALNDQLNYTFVNSSFVSGDDIYFGDWNISDTITKYGNFRILTQWNNGTDAGFFRDDITILAETNLEINQPSQDTTFNSSTIFNVTITYRDREQDLDISDGDIYYKINSGTYSSVNESVTYIGSGKYNITFDCNNTEFNYGSNTITFRANNTYHNNQTGILNIIILGETNLSRPFPKTYNFDSGETFNITLYFNDTVKNVGINESTVDITVNSSAYTPLDFYDYGDGYYNITVNCSDDVFDIQGYGFFNLSINSEKINYYSQTISFVIYIKGETSLAATKFPEPSKGYYNSDETFNITVFFNDTARNEGINDGIVKVYVKNVSSSIYQLYDATTFPYGIGYHNFTVNCSDSEFENYGKYDIKINVSKQHYYNASFTFFGELVIGNTTLTIKEPSGMVSHVDDETFDIKIEYIDHTKSERITEADITYTINGTGYRSDNVIDNPDGTYNITIDVGDSDFENNYGYRNIIINANKTNYVNLTVTFTFERQVSTQISPTNTPALFEVIRGKNVTFTFNYSDKFDNPIEKYDNFQNITNLNNFEWYLWNDGNGNYTLEVDSTNVIVKDTPYELNFSISVFGNQTQEFSLTILVTIIQTRIESESWNENADFARSTDINISIIFYFNDTDNNEAITGLLDTDIIIRNYDTGILWSPGFELFDLPGDGNYKLNISTLDIDSGYYNLELNISKFPNYDLSITYVQFYLRGNYTTVNINSVSDLGGEGLLTPVGNNYSAFIERNIYVDFTLTDNEFSNELITGDANSYVITYYEILNVTNQGTTTHTLTFDANTDSYNGYLTTSSLTVGTYAVNITVIKTNYENSVFSFNLTVKPRFNVRISVVDQPTAITAGDSFFITFKAEYYNGTDWLPLIGTNIILTPYFNGISSTPITIATNDTGIAIFEITIRNDATNMTLLVEIQVSYNHLADTLQISDIGVIPLTPGLTFEDLLPYIIIIGAVVALAGGSLAVYRGVVVPKKREKQRILTEVKTIFDDAINLEHILVLYKGTGTCIFFKSYGSEQIDPELIGGFLTAVSSFGKEMATQEALNEISYGDKMLLLADGEYIRVALVLGKKASLILRRHLKDFINTFGKMFKDDLPNWRGQLNPFRNAGLIVDEILNTSIILPHQISDDFSRVKELKNPHARDVLKVAHSCCEETERSFLFIATLLKETSEKTNKDTAEIFIGIKELRDRKILIPIEISAIEAQPVSQQEINLINQKVTSLTNLSNEEKQNLVNFLAQLGPIEREAYLSSLTKQHEIVSAPIKTTIGTIIVDNMKSAKKGVKELSKRAKIAKKKKNYLKTIELYQSAAMLASNWELSNEFVQIEDIIRKTKIENLSVKKKDLEKEAKDAVKSKNYAEASAKYKYASQIASEIFKLGASDMTKEVKRLTNKANEYEKLK